MDIVLCSGRHDILTNDGKMMQGGVHYGEVVNPTDMKELESMCGHWIRNFMENNVHPHKEEFLNLYITGLTPLLTSFLKKWVERQDELEMHHAKLVLWHWDRESESYVRQPWAVIT